MILPVRFICILTITVAYSSEFEFIASQREASAAWGQVDPVVLWYGKQTLPSKHNIAHAWKKVANVLLVQRSRATARELLVWIMQWYRERDVEFQARPRHLYLAGEWGDGVGEMLCEVALLMHSQVWDWRMNAPVQIEHHHHPSNLTLAGLLLGNAPPLSPSAVFVANRALDTGNGKQETAYKLTLAKRVIQCNTFLSEVDFVMHDVVLRYHPVPREVDASEGHHDYTLSTLADMEHCWGAHHFPVPDMMEGGRLPSLPNPAQPHTSFKECNSSTSNSTKLDYGHVMSYLSSHGTKVALFITLRTGTIQSFLVRPCKKFGEGMAKCGDIHKHMGGGQAGCN